MLIGINLNEEKMLNKTQINSITTSLILIFSGLVFSPSLADWTSQLGSAPSAKPIFPKIPAYFIGFDFTGYSYPSNEMGVPYTKTTIISKSGFLNSPLAFEVSAGSPTATFISASMPVTSANLVIGLIDDEGSEFTINADVINNTNKKNNYLIKTDDIPGGVSEGLATLVTANGDTNTVLEKMPIFITQTVADKNSFNPSLAPTFTDTIPILNRSKKSGELYYTGTQLPNKTLNDGMTVLATKSTGLRKYYIYPATSFTSGASKTYNYNEVSRQITRMKDTSASGTGVTIAITLFGIELIEFPIPTCTSKCGDEF